MKAKKILGTAHTVGGLRKLLSVLPDGMDFGFRNAPTQELSVVTYDEDYEAALFDLPDPRLFHKEFQLPNYKTKYKTGVDMAEGESQGMLRAHIFGTGYADSPENKYAQGYTVANFRKMMDQCSFDPKPGELIRLLQFNECLT